jgi:hypothetical protein
VFCDDSRVVDEKGRNGNEDENDMEDFEQICEIRGMTCLIGLGRTRMGVITRQIGTRSCHIEDGKLTWADNSLKIESLMMISPVPSRLSLSCPQFCHHLRTQS